MDWDTLKTECLACTKCELCQTRTNVVFGQGAQNAEVLFVGEGPGQSEDEQGLPFVGRSGQLLDKYLFAIDLDGSTGSSLRKAASCSWAPSIRPPCCASRRTSPPPFQTLPPCGTRSVLCASTPTRAIEIRNQTPLFCIL